LKLIKDAARKNTDSFVFEPTTMNFREQVFKHCKPFFFDKN